MSASASAAAEKGVISLLSEAPELFKNGAGPNPEDFSSPELRHIYETMLELLSKGLPSDANSLSAHLSPDEVSLFTGIVQEPVSVANGSKALADYIHKIESSKDGAAVKDPRALAEELRKTKGYGG